MKAVMTHLVLIVLLPRHVALTAALPAAIVIHAASAMQTLVVAVLHVAHVALRKSYFKIEQYPTNDRNSNFGQHQL